MIQILTTNPGILPQIVTRYIFPNKATKQILIYSLYLQSQYKKNTAL